MKFEVNEPAQPEAKERKYPWIGLGDRTGCIVLFHKKGCGTTLNKTGVYLPGVYQISWGEGSFVELAGSITLSND